MTIGAGTILAIDTATPLVSCALGRADGLVGEFEAIEARRHGEVLAPAIERLCRQHHVAMTELTAIAVDIGPGLFTGLRVGMATAMALASALDVPVIGINSLEAVAYPRHDDGRAIAAVIDVRRAEVAWALYASSSLDVLHEPEVVTPTGLAESLAASAVIGAPATEVLLVGDGSVRYSAELAEIPGVAPAGEEDRYPRARSVYALALPRLVGARSGESVVPMYLRSADVRIGWDQRDAPLGASRG